MVGRWRQPTACVRHCSNLFSFYFSDKIYQIGVLLLKNFHFSLSFFKNGVKRSKNPILHDSRESSLKIPTDDFADVILASDDTDVIACDVLNLKLDFISHFCFRERRPGDNPIFSVETF